MCRGPHPASARTPGTALLVCPAAALRLYKALPTAGGAAVDVGAAAGPPSSAYGREDEPRPARRGGGQTRRPGPAPLTRTPRCWGRGDPRPPGAGQKPERSAPPLHPPPRPGPPPSLPSPAAPQPRAGDWKKNWERRAWRTYAQGFSAETFFSFRFSILWRSPGRGPRAPPGLRRGWDCTGVGAGGQGWAEDGWGTSGLSPHPWTRNRRGLFAWSSSPRRRAPTRGAGAPRPTPSPCSAYPRAFQSCHSRAKAGTPAARRQGRDGKEGGRAQLGKGRPVGLRPAANVSPSKRGGVSC